MLKLLRLLSLWSVLLLLAGCTPLEPPAKSGELVVGVRETPAFFQRDGERASGFEHDLVSAFAESAGLKVRFVAATDALALNELIASGRVHMAASLATGTGQYRHSVPNRSVAQLVVGHADGLGPDELTALTGHTIEVAAGSTLADTLRGLDAAARPTVVEVPATDEMGLLARLAGRHDGLVAVHETHLDLAMNFHPELRALLRLPGRVDLAWAFADNDDLTDLRTKADQFLSTARADGTLARIHDRYFGHIKRINPNGITQFIGAIQNRLPHYRRHFHAAQELSGIDWRLIAALAYQESMWDPLATSPTNVRGMMMLTEDTADYLRVSNRLDAAESIRAGARYLAELVQQVPAAAPHPDRLWLALAAYNLGMGHFRGARAIAAGMRRNADDWYEMKQVLPLLARPEIYARLKSGRARGGEAVIMVENIRTYYDVLMRFEPEHAVGLGQPRPDPVKRR